MKLLVFREDFDHNRIESLQIVHDLLGVKLKVARMDNESDSNEPTTSVSLAVFTKHPNESESLLRWPKRSYEAFSEQMEVNPSRKTLTEMPWEYRTFFKRECVKFVERKIYNGVPRCQCGLARSEHCSIGDSSMISDSEFRWRISECTRKVPTDTYGEIEFAEDASSRKPYIRVSEDTDAVHILELMMERWDLKVPNLVISVSGGAKSFHMPKLKEEAFGKGLVKAAASTGAWVITGGLNTGVMRHVGEAVKDYAHVGRGEDKINVIGIATWGIVSRNEALISSDGQGLYPAYYSMRNVDRCKHPLDVNHSHFILVDDGTFGRYGVEIPLRHRVERAFTEGFHTLSNTTAGKTGTPMVSLCLEGGPGTIKTMKDNIRQGIPYVIIDGSGRSADVLAYAYSKLIFVSENEGYVIDPGYVDEVKEMVSKSFGERNMELIYMDIVEVLKDEKMVTVYRLDDEEAAQDIDLIILRALMKVQRSDVESQLLLALAWNRSDVAELEIFSEQAETQVTAEQLENAMVTAMVDNKPDFVRLFLSAGLSVTEFLTPKVLVSLYEKLPQDTPFKLLLTSSKSNNNTFSFQFIEGVIEKLLSVQDAGIGFRESKRTAWIDLFVWAVLANYREIALVFMARGRKQLIMSLIGTQLLKSMRALSLFSDLKEDVANDVLEHEAYYESLICNTLSCFEESRLKLKLKESLLEELPYFGYQRPLDVILREDMVSVRKHSFFHEAFHQNEGQAKEDEECSLNSFRLIGGTTFKMFSSFLVYVAFLGMFAYVIMTKPTSDHNILKWIIFAFALGYAIDEIRQIVAADSASGRVLYFSENEAMAIRSIKQQTARILTKLRKWWSSPWNILDFISLVLYFLAFSFSFSFPYASKVIMALDAFFWFIKTSQFLRISASLGPYMVMIFQMLHHLKIFMIMITILAIAYGIFMHTLLFPSSLPSWKILFGVLFRPYLLLFGELGLESYELSGKNTVFGTAKVPLASEIIVVLGMSFTVLLANVLLVNLLIAVFSGVYEEVKEDSVAIWRYETQEIYREYQNKPILPVPFSICQNVYHILCYIRCGSLPKSRHGGNSRSGSDDAGLRKLEQLAVEEWQKHGLSLFHFNSRVKLSDENTAVVARVNDKMEELLDREQLNRRLQFMENKLTEEQKSLNKRLQSVEDILKDIKLRLIEKV